MAKQSTKLTKLIKLFKSVNSHKISDTEYIVPVTPELAAKIVANSCTHDRNRDLNETSMNAYRKDMLSGEWVELLDETMTADSGGEMTAGNTRMHALAAIDKDSGIAIRFLFKINISMREVIDSGQCRARSRSDCIKMAFRQLEHDGEKVGFSLTQGVLLDKMMRSTSEALKTLGLADQNETYLWQKGIKMDNLTHNIRGCELLYHDDFFREVLKLKETNEAQGREIFRLYKKSPNINKTANITDVLAIKGVMGGRVPPYGLITAVYLHGYKEFARWLFKLIQTDPIKANMRKATEDCVVQFRNASIVDDPQSSRKGKFLRGLLSAAIKAWDNRANVDQVNAMSDLLEMLPEDAEVKRKGRSRKY